MSYLIFFKLLTFVFIASAAQRDNVKEDMSTDEGYVITSTENSLSTVEAANPLDCPSKTVYRIKYKCPSANGKWSDCIRLHCCPGFNLIGGKCFPKDVDPCNFNICEQRCEVILRRVVCTCWDGYRFSPERQRKGENPTCIDINECTEGIHDCEHICENIAGGYLCYCNEGFVLRKDKKTCEKSGNKMEANCFSSCETVSFLQEKVKKLQEKLSALETAMKLSVCPPSSLELHKNTQKSSIHTGSAAFSDNSADKTYSVLNSFVQSGGTFCKCQRGAIGPPGPSGISGQKGDKGDRGSRGPKGNSGDFDFFLLLLADVRHDIVLLQERVFPGETLPKFDMESVLKKQRSVKDTGGTQDFQGKKTSLPISNYPSAEEQSPEASGDEWDQS